MKKRFSKLLKMFIAYSTIPKNKFNLIKLHHMWVVTVSN